MSFIFVGKAKAIARYAICSVLQIYFCSTHCIAANWIEYGSSYATIQYFDKDSIRQNGNVISYRIVINDRYAVTPSLSGVIYFELICKSNEMRATKLVNTTMHFGEGYIVGVVDPAIFRREGNIFTKNYDKELIAVNNIICNTLKNKRNK